MIALHAVLKFGLPGGGAVLAKVDSRLLFALFSSPKSTLFPPKPAQLIRRKVMEGILPHALQGVQLTPILMNASMSRLY